MDTHLEKKVHSNLARLSTRFRSLLFCFSNFERLRKKSERSSLLFQSRATIASSSSPFTHTPIYIFILLRVCTAPKPKSALQARLLLAAWVSAASSLVYINAGQTSRILITFWGFTIYIFFQWGNNNPHCKFFALSPLPRPVFLPILRHYLSNAL